MDFLEFLRVGGLGIFLLRLLYSLIAFGLSIRKPGVQGLGHLPGSIFMGLCRFGGVDVGLAEGVGTFI